MVATLDSIETAAFTALSALAKTATPPGAFALVGRFYGELRVTLQGVTVVGEALHRNPAALLQLGSERADNDLRTTAGNAETRGRTKLTVWVVTQDTRGSTVIAKGTTGTVGPPAIPGSQGALTSVDQVIAALNGLVINDLLRNTRLRYVGFDTRSADPNSHLCHEVTFEAERAVPVLTPVDTGVPLETIHQHVNLEGTDGEAPNPVNEGETHPNALEFDEEGLGFDEGLFYS